MQSHASWSISLGRWGGLHVRLHMFFLLFAAFTMYLSWLPLPVASSADLRWIAVASLGILLLSVVLHEWGHLQVAMRLGGGGDEIVLWPLGGLVPMHAPRDPAAEFLVHLAGPAVNLLVCVGCGILFLFLPDVHISDLIHPFAPRGLAEGDWGIRIAKLAFWINWCLLLLNLLPVFPFDGGRALRAALLVLQPQRDVRHSSMLVAALAKVSAVAILVLALLVWNIETNGRVPIWFPLVLLAIFLWFSAKQEEERPQEPESEESPFGYDFSEGYTSLDRNAERPSREAGFLTRWLMHRGQARRRRQQDVEADEEQRVDEVLARLHQHGIDSLSPQDRSLLKRVSARYRQRDEM
ncbi:MAG: site-2 protease family protein [Pirellulaceae bacterium]